MLGFRSNGANPCPDRHGFNVFQHMWLDNVEDADLDRLPPNDASTEVFRFGGVVRCQTYANIVDMCWSAWPDRQCFWHLSVLPLPLSATKEPAIHTDIFACSWMWNLLCFNRVHCPLRLSSLLSSRHHLSSK